MDTFEESLKDDDKKYLAKGKVTTMSYDLETKDDSNINQEIKGYLNEKGWHFTVPKQKVVSCSKKERIVKDADTPFTTTWKEAITPDEAIKEFCIAIEAYNTKHVNDKPAKFGRGNVFAICNNEYDSMKIE